MVYTADDTISISEFGNSNRHKLYKNIILQNKNSDTNKSVQNKNQLFVNILQYNSSNILQYFQ